MHIRIFSKNYAFKILLILMVNVIVSESFLQAGEPFIKTEEFGANDGITIIENIYIFDDEYFNLKSREYDRIDSICLLSPREYSSKVCLENCYIYSMRTVCTIKPDDTFFQAVTAGLYDCVGISLRKYSDDSFFVSHVERDGCLTSFEKILEKWLDGETENLQVDLVTRYNSPILLKVVDLLTKLNISVSSLTRAELTNTDQRHIVFEGSPAVENKKVCRLYFPYSYAQEARENWGSFSCKYLSGASLFVDAKEKFIGFEIPDPYLEMTFQLFGGELTDEEKDHFMSSNEFRIIENVNGEYYYVDCLELILSGKKDYLLRS